MMMTVTMVDRQTHTYETVEPWPLLTRIQELDLTQVDTVTVDRTGLDEEGRQDVLFELAFVIMGDSLTDERLAELMLKIHIN